MSRVLLISRSREYEARMETLLGSELTVAMGAFLTFGTEIVLEQIDAANIPQVAFLGPFLSYDEARELSTGLRERFPGIGLLLVHENHAVIEDWVSDLGLNAVVSPTADNSAVIEALAILHAWLIEVGHVPPEAPPLEAALAPEPGEASDDDDDAADADAVPDSVVTESAGSAEPQTSVRAQIIAVVSPKGGQGKTTVATNLAIGLARLEPMSVVLLDADMQFGDVATVLGLEPAHTLPDMVTGLAPRDPMVLKTFLTAHPSGFHVVCGAESPGDGDRVTGDQLGHLVRQLAEIFRFVIVDTSPGLGEHTLAVLEEATDAVALCSMAVPSVRGLRKELAVLASIGIMPAARHVVLNFADRMSGLSPHDVEETVGVPVDVTIPRSAAVPLSTNRGIPLLQGGSRDPAAKALGRLVARFDHTTSAERGFTYRRKVVA